MENKEETNDYNYILNMEALPEFDETTGEFFWNNNDPNSNKKNNNEEEGKKEQENKDKIENFLKENSKKFISSVSKINNANIFS